MIRSRTRFLIQGFTLFALYTLVGVPGLHIHSITGLSSFIWLPCGLGLAALVLFDERLWPFIFLSSLLLHGTDGLPLLPNLLVAAGNSLECWLGAVLLKKFAGPKPTLSKVREVLDFLFWTVGLNTLLGALIMVGGIYWLGSPQPASFVLMLRTWWLSAALSVLVVGSSAICWKNHIWPKLPRLKAPLWEAVLIAVITATLCVFIYTPLARSVNSVIVRPSILYLLLGWATLRFELMGATSAMLLIGLIESIGMSFGYVVPAKIEPNQMILLQQTHLMNFGVVSMLLAAAIREREDALQARSEFLSIAAHELRAPVTTALLQLQLFRKQLADLPENPAIRLPRLNSLERALQQMKRLSHTLEQLLDISKIDQRNLELRPARLDLSKLIVGVVDRIAPQAQRANCPITTELKAEVECGWDPFRIEQVLVNLLSNAIKYAPGRPVRISSALTDGFIEIRVDDQGPGISKSMQPYIFDRFVRANDMTDVKGLGLGLFISRQIIEAHEGKIWVESDIGMGARFCIRLPAELGKKENGADSVSGSK